MLNLLKDACKHFHINKLSYCILRLPKSDASPHEFEVDILIKDTELANFHNILTANGFRYEKDSNPSHHNFKKERLKLALVILLGYGRKKEHFVSLGYDVLGRVVFRDDMYFIGEIDEFEMLLMRCLFDKKDFSKYSTKLFKLIDSIGEERCVKGISNIFSSPK